MAGTGETGKRKKYGYGRGCGRKGSWGCGGARTRCAGRAGYLLSAAFLLGGSALSAEASPASLASGSAVVYEHTSETSAPLENLIQDGSFEYLGDVTAEDGRVWHAVETAGGVSGYIRGDIEIRALQTQQETPEHTENEENAGQAPDEGENRETPEEGAAAQEAPEENGADETGENGEEDGEETSEEIPEIQTVENKQAKTYAADALAKKIRGREDQKAENADAAQEAQDGERKPFGKDVTFLLCILVVGFSAAAAFIFLKKLGKESGKREKSPSPETAVEKRAPRNERKRRKSRRKKNKKHGKRHPYTNRESGGQKQNGRK